MLLIAGGVSAVLLSRGQEAISDLELASVGGINLNNCEQTEHTVRGVTSSKGVVDAANTKCTFTFAAALTGANKVTLAECKRLDRSAVLGTGHASATGGTCDVSFT